MAKFGPGNKAAANREKKSPGRPTKEVVERKKLAAAHALKYLEDHYLKGAVDALGMMAVGHGPRGGKLHKRLERVNPQAVYKLLDKFIPDAPRRIDLGLADTMEDFVGQVVSGEIYKAMEEEEAELVNPAIEDKTEEDGDV